MITFRCHVQMHRPSILAPSLSLGSDWSSLQKSHFEWRKLWSCPLSGQNSAWREKCRSPRDERDPLNVDAIPDWPFMSRNNFQPQPAWHGQMLPMPPLSAWQKNPIFSVTDQTWHVKIRARQLPDMSVDFELLTSYRLCLFSQYFYWNNYIWIAHSFMISNVQPFILEQPWSLSHADININQLSIELHLLIFSSSSRTTWGPLLIPKYKFGYIRTCPRCSQDCLKSCSPRVTGKMRNWLSVFRLWFGII